MKHPLPYFREGDGTASLSASAMNRLVDAIRESDRRLVEVERRTTPDNSFERKPIVVQRLVVVDANFPDTVLCATAPGGPGVVHVAKPYLLRRTPFHNQRRDGIEFVYTSNTERTATRREPPPAQGQEPPTENQRIIPKYVADDVITAVTQALEGADDLRVEAGSETRLYTSWVDLNLDGRYWAKV